MACDFLGTVWNQTEDTSPVCIASVVPKDIMDESTALLVPESYFAGERVKVRVGRAYQVYVPDAVDPAVAAAATQKSRIQSHCVATSVQACGIVATEALATFIEEVRSLSSGRDTLQVACCQSNTPASPQTLCMNVDFA